MKSAGLHRLPQCGHRRRPEARRPLQRRHAVGGGVERLSIPLDGGATVLWSEPRSCPGETVFVAAPGAGAEDAGVLLSLVWREGPLVSARAGRHFNERVRPRVAAARHSVLSRQLLHDGRA